MDLGAGTLPHPGRRRRLDVEQIDSPANCVPTAEERPCSKPRKVAEQFQPVRMPARTADSTLPPDNTITVRPAGVTPRRYAASATAPLGSLTRCASTARSRTAA